MKNSNSLTEFVFGLDNEYITSKLINYSLKN